MRTEKGEEDGKILYRVTAKPYISTLRRPERRIFRDWMFDKDNSGGLSNKFKTD
jgi:hypothetical protein